MTQDSSKQKLTDTPEYRFLHELAADMSAGDLSFPTFLDATLKVRMALKSPTVTAETLARIVMSEPLLSAKVIRLANSAALNPGGKPVSDLKTAVVRIGFSSVRTLAISVAMDQLLQAKEMEAYASFARALWEHCLEVAALAHVISRRMTRLNPHEAMFAGLVHDIGQFYLLSRLTKFPELASGTEKLLEIMTDWHTAVGHAVLSTLGIPEEIIQAVDDHEMPFEDPEPRTLGHVIYLANEVAANRNPFSSVDYDDALPRATTRRLVGSALSEVISESRQELESIMAALKG